jgi:uncharacterized SAM-binding protein YcdF (DUF218 family)
MIETEKKADAEDLRLAKILWDYHRLNQEPQTSDLIFVLGSHDLRVAERAVELYRQGLAPYILFSGKRGALTRDWTETEAERFAALAKARDIPEEKIFVEAKATNTGENIRYGHVLLLKKGHAPRRMILVQKPYMERRTLATFLKQWPGEKTEVFVTSPRIPFEDYPTEEIPVEQVIAIMVGDLYRIKEYPAKGFQVPQEIPQEVMAAAEALVRRGYTGHMPAE